MAVPVLIEKRAQVLLLFFGRVSDVADGALDVAGSRQLYCNGSRSAAFPAAASFFF